MDYIEKVEWLKRAREAIIDTPFCDEFYIDLVNIEKEVYNHELKLFKNIVHSVNNNLVVINNLNDMKLDFQDDDIIDYFEIGEMICFENIRKLCNQTQNLYFKNRIKTKYDYLRDNEEENDEINLALSILDNDVLDVLNYTNDKDSHILKLK